MTVGSLAKKVFSPSGGGKGGVYYPSTGIDYLSVCLGEAVLDYGGDIQLNSKVTEIIDRGRTKEVIFQKQGEAMSVAADFLISTMPIRPLIEILKPMPADLLDAAGGLKSRTLFTLFLMVDRKSVTKHGCIYFSENKFPFKRMTEFRNLSPNTAPENKTGLCIEMTRGEHEVIKDVSDSKAVYDQAMAALEKEGFFRESDVIDYEVKTIPFAYPVYDMSYLKKLVAILGHLAGVKNMVTLGRNGLFTYNTMANSIRSAHMLGQRLAESGSESIDDIVSGFYSTRVEKYTRVPFGEAYRPNQMFIE
ncbi:MAG: FAD-dependent oxidoreductase [Deltaproteobacteria bacterium]|nr:FAD-dependent oxidoreductase [Deltaproteobacteria bacterium]